MLKNILKKLIIICIAFASIVINPGCQKTVDCFDFTLLEDGTYSISLRSPIMRTGKPKVEIRDDKSDQKMSMSHSLAGA